MRTLLGLLVFACLTAGLLAQSPVCAGPYRTINATPHYQPSSGDYQTPTHRRRVNIVTDVLQVNPTYTSAYSPDGYDSATQQDILAALRSLTKRLDDQDKANLAAIVAKAVATPAAPSSPPAVLPPATPTPPASSPGALSPARPASGGGAAGLAVMVAKCAQCHQAGKLAPDQRFTLLDAKGSLSQLTDRQKLKTLMKVYREEMPPPKNIYGITPVTDAEYAAIVDLLGGG